MGLDGGTIITRSDVLRGQSWRMAQADTSRSTRGGTVSTSSVYLDPQADAETRRVVLWTTCALSGAPLVPPILADPLGHLVNKEPLLELLLARKGSFADEAARHRYDNLLRSSRPGAWDHIKSLRGMLTVHLTPEPAVGGGAQRGLSGQVAAAGGNGPAREATSVPWFCPVAHVPFGKYPCCALRGCGHVLSKKVLDELLSSAGKGGSTSKGTGGTRKGAGSTPLESAGGTKDGASGSCRSGTEVGVGACNSTVGSAAAAGGGENEETLVSSSSLSSACPVCGALFSAEDLLPLNGTPEQEAALLAKLKAPRGAAGGKGKRKRKSSEGCAGEELEVKQLASTGTAGGSQLWKM